MKKGNNFIFLKKADITHVWIRVSYNQQDIKNQFFSARSYSFVKK